MDADIKIDLKSEDVKDVTITLINKFCDGISWLANRPTPHRIAVEEYIADIQNNTSLDAKTKAVLIYNAKKDIKKWSNTSSICERAADKLLPTANPDSVDDDWRNIFTDHAENISNEDMQEIWSFILAQECNEPGSIPKALLNTLFSMGKREAEYFEKLASFCVYIVDADGKKGDAIPLIINTHINDYYNDHGLGLDALYTLETLGLVNMDISPLGGIATSVDNTSVIEYFDETINVSDVYTKDGQLSVGAVSLSFIGEALMKIMVPKKIEGFFESVAVPYFKNPNKHIDDMFE